MVRWDRVGSGSPVVMLHGTPWSSALWRAIAEDLAVDHTVYLWDMPGYGLSSKDPDHPVDLAVQSELFAHLLRLWGLDRPRVIAHDIGGAVALRARLLHDADYDALCLVDVVAVSPWGSPFYRLVQRHADVFPQLPPAIHRGALEAYIAGASACGLTREDLEELTRPWLGDRGQAAFYRQIAQSDERYTDEVESAYGQITEPVHLIWGAADTWIPADRVGHLQERMPHATATVIDGAGHLIQLDAPDELRHAIRAWVAT